MHDTAALRTLEARAAAALGDDYALMQRAGEAAWCYLLQHWPKARCIVVACGPGNNGGDGYVLARHAKQAGRDVRVVRASAPRSALGQRACADYATSGGTIGESIDDVLDAELVVDAVLGIGLSRAPENGIGKLVDAINACCAPVLALDVPSGIDADSGATPGRAVHATRTLQLLAAHPGLYTGAALDHVGRRDVDKLAIDETLLQSMPACAHAVDVSALAHWLPKRKRDSHKGDNGHVLCIGGDDGSGGAIMLCADAALRSGAGLVSVATRAGNVAAILARRPEAMTHAFNDLSGFEALAARADVIAIGPGLGQGAWGKACLDKALGAGKPLLLDADALNLLAAEPHALPADTILTPHPGEAARLLACDTAQVQADRFAAAQSLVACYGCIIVLKGAGTIVAGPQRTPYVIAAGNPGMAVGGMGDLLSGVIVALRAQGMDAFDAAACGALLHSAAGDLAAREGQRGMLPSDLLPALRTLANPVSVQ